MIDPAVSKSTPSQILAVRCEVISADQECVYAYMLARVRDLDIRAFFRPNQTIATPNLHHYHFQRRLQSFAVFTILLEMHARDDGHHLHHQILSSIHYCCCLERARLLPRRCLCCRYNFRGPNQAMDYLKIPLVECFIFLFSE